MGLEDYIYDRAMNPLAYFYDNIGLGKTDDPTTNPWTQFAYSTNPLGNSTSDNSSWFNPNWLMGIGAIGSIGTGLFNAFNALEANRMARQQYNFQKNLANRNVANQAKIINNTYDNAANVGAALNYTGDSLADQRTLERFRNAARNRYVDGSSVG